MLWSRAVREGEQLLGGLTIRLDHGFQRFLADLVRNGVHIHTIIRLKPRTDLKLLRNSYLDCVLGEN